MAVREKMNELLRAAAKALRDFQEKFRTDADCGQSFCEILRSLEQSLGHFQIKYDYLCGKDTLLVEGVTRGYLPKCDDAVLIDLSVGKEGVWCDVCRTFFVGESSARQRETFDLVRESLRAGECALAAGVAAERIFAAADGVFKTKGKKLVHHAGHALGAEPLMAPRFLAGEREKLAKNTFVTVETGLYEGFGLRLEDDYFIGESVENLFEEWMPLKAEEYVLHG